MTEPVTGTAGDVRKALLEAERAIRTAAGDDPEDELLAEEVEDILRRYVAKHFSS
jgi:hypothetical protein